MKLHEIANILLANIDKLPARDQDFARSLAEKAVKANLGGWQLSEKQQHWVVAMARKATGREAPAAQPAAGLRPIVDFLEAAHQHLKKPKLRFIAGGETLMLSIAGERSSAPGSIDVKHATRGELNPETGFTRKDWYGRIGLDGVYRGSGKFDQGPVREALQAIAANPVAAAKLFGQKTSSCCFCGQELTDGASIAVGYGPICAEHWGLPHGEDHGVKGGHREQQEIAQKLAPVTPSAAPIYYKAPKKPVTTVSDADLNDPIDDLWVDGFVGH
jgi:Family of unknown function (DUF6011)